MKWERTRREKQADDHDPLEAVALLEEPSKCNSCPVQDEGKLMACLEDLNSEDCQLEQARRELKVIMQDIQTTTASLGRRASVEVVLQEGPAVSVTEKADPGGEACERGEP